MQEIALTNLERRPLMQDLDGTNFPGNNFPANDHPGSNLPANNQPVPENNHIIPVEVNQLNSEADNRDRLSNKVIRYVLVRFLLIFIGFSALNAGLFILVIFTKNGNYSYHTVQVIESSMISVPEKASISISVSLSNNCQNVTTWFSEIEAQEFFNLFPKGKTVKILSEDNHPCQLNPPPDTDSFYFGISISLYILFGISLICILFPPAFCSFGNIPRVHTRWHNEKKMRLLYLLMCISFILTIIGMHLMSHQPVPPIYSKGMVISVYPFGEGCNLLFSLGKENINTNNTCQYFNGECASLGDVMMLRIKDDHLECYPALPGKEVNSYVLGLSLWIIGSIVVMFAIAYFLSGCQYFINLKVPEDYPMNEIVI